jgi:hypothetical protein
MFVPWRSWRTPQGGIEKNPGGSSFLFSVIAVVQGLGFVVQDLGSGAKAKPDVKKCKSL